MDSLNWEGCHSSAERAISAFRLIRSVRCRSFRHRTRNCSEIDLIAEAHPLQVERKLADLCCRFDAS
jgi:hypothetical protein